MKVFINPEFTALVDVLKLRFKNLEIFNPKEYERRKEQTLKGTNVQRN